MKLGVNIFADTADPARIRALASDPRVIGFTTNPTLFRAAGASNYLEHARACLDAADGKQVSLEVIADDLDEMARQAATLSALDRAQVCVKIPVMTTQRVATYDLVRRLAADGVSINVTAVFTARQVAKLVDAIAAASPFPQTVIISIFAGRIADAGQDPLEIVSDCRMIVQRARSPARVLWASPRQVFDYILADRAACDIITMTPELIAKLPLLGKDLFEFSRETVQMFCDDARKSGFVL